MRALLMVAGIMLGQWQVSLAQDLPVMPPDLAPGLLARFDEASSKVLQLAEAIPAERYGWRPGPGVRSVSEVLVHIALGNYYTSEGAGVAIPPGVPDDAEQSVVEKSAVLSFLSRATTHLRSLLVSLDEDDLRRPVTMFGQATSAGNVYLFGVGHVQEHLGQLIAYARMGGVRPPWSEPD